LWHWQPYHPIQFNHVDTTWFELTTRFISTSTTPILLSTTRFATIWHRNFDFGLIPYNHHGHYHIIGCYSWLLSMWPSPPYSHFPQHSLRVETAPFMGEYWKCPEQSRLPVCHRWPHHSPIFIYSVSSCLSLHSAPISISYILPTVTRRLPSVVTTTPTEGKSSFTCYFFLSYSLYYLTVVTYLQQVCSSQYSRYHHTDWGQR
jgi:hypothetical protein